MCKISSIKHYDKSLLVISIIALHYRTCYKYKVGINLLTYGPSILREARPSTTALQRLLFCAVVTSCRHPMPVSCTFLVRSLLQVFLGRPLFLLPWGFQDRAWYVMFVAGLRRVWPSHPHRLRSNSSSIGSWFVTSQSLSFLIFSGQWIFRICLRHLLIKV